MTADIVNLRSRRKAKARDAKQRQAAENRARFGRTKTARQVDTLANERAERAHLGHALQRPSQHASPTAGADVDEAHAPDQQARPPGPTDRP